MKEIVWEDLSNEQQDHVIRTAQTLGTRTEEIIFSLQQFCLAAIKLVESISQIFEDVINEITGKLKEQRHYEPEEIIKWNVPRKIIMKSQVLNRKPKYISIRNRI